MRRGFFLNPPYVLHIQAMPEGAGWGSARRQEGRAPARAWGDDPQSRRAFIAAATTRDRKGGMYALGEGGKGAQVALAAYRREEGAGAALTSLLRESVEGFPQDCALEFRNVWKCPPAWLIEYYWHLIDRNPKRTMPGFPPHPESSAYQQWGEVWNGGVRLGFLFFDAPPDNTSRDYPSSEEERKCVYIRARDVDNVKWSTETFAKLWGDPDKAVTPETYLRYCYIVNSKVREEVDELVEGHVGPRCCMSYMFTEYYRETVPYAPPCLARTADLAWQYIGPEGQDKYRARFEALKAQARREVEAERAGAEQ